MDDFAADIDAFMEAVGIDEVTLVGHPSGGLIVQRVALSYPRRVSHLVLIGSPTTLVNNEALIELGEEMLALEDPIPPEFVESTIHHPVPEEFVAGAVSECLKAPARVWRDYWEGVLLAANDTARLGEIGAPTLILWGKRDALLPHVEQELRVAAIPDATLRVYPETGHAVAGERPEWVVRDLEAFMRGTAPPSSSSESLPRASENPLHPKFAELFFHTLGCISLCSPCGTALYRLRSLALDSVLDTIGTGTSMGRRPERRVAR